MKTVTLQTTPQGPLIHRSEHDSLKWRHNERDGVSNHRHFDCLLNPFFRRSSKKASKLHATGLCVGNSPVTGEFLAQRASNAENITIWWRHHGTWGFEPNGGHVADNIFLKKACHPGGHYYDYSTGILSFSQVTGTHSTIRLHPRVPACQIWCNYLTKMIGYQEGSPCNGLHVIPTDNESAWLRHRQDKHI